ncbi:MAG TPA: hypothetical protein VF214_11210 [Edaphobacter sp.]
MIRAVSQQGEHIERREILEVRVLIASGRADCIVDRLVKVCFKRVYVAGAGEHRVRLQFWGDRVVKGPAKLLKKRRGCLNPRALSRYGTGDQQPSTRVVVAVVGHQR